MLFRDLHFKCAELPAVNVKNDRAWLARIARQGTGLPNIKMPLIRYFLAVTRTLKVRDHHEVARARLQAP